MGTLQTIETTQGEHMQEKAAGGMVEVAQSRAAQETQAMMIVARRFPRDQEAACARIMRSCQRKSLAEQAIYAYPRGGQTVTGPSIRLAESMAQAWGNLDFGITEIEQRHGESTIMAYAWDLETNVRQTKIFTVPHVRHTKKGAYPLRDPRDIYELTANQGARRLRACILGVIPGDIIEAAVERCGQTLQEGNSIPLIERVRKMVAVFRDFGVSAEMMEARLGHRLDTTTEHELVQLRAIYRSIKDNMQPVEAFFDRAPGGNGQSLKDKVRQRAEQTGGNGSEELPPPAPPRHPIDRGAPPAEPPFDHPDPAAMPQDEPAAAARDKMGDYDF